MANLQDVRWDDVRIFLAVHRQHTLAAAAARLGLDTSTVSRRLAALEADLGERLFERTREGLQPARAAERVLAAAEAMEAAHARLARDASDVERLAEGVVRISTAPGLSSTFIAPALPKLRKKYPRIAIELDAHIAPRDLTRYEADLALRSVRSQGAELVTTKLVTAPWVAAAAPRVAAKLGTIRDWGAASWVQWDRDLASFPPARWVAQHVPASAIALRTSDFPAQLAAVRAGLGLMLAPVPYLAPWNLVAVEFAAALPHEWSSDDLWLVGHRALRDVPRIAAVWDFLASEFRT
ncbi:MAG TPA: LysR family transcriptional regulator [Kofleriaceae bacterium]|nr:LysR family transcriptional regulator [Kofleriaceae bacterium]